MKKLIILTVLVAVLTTTATLMMEGCDGKLASLSAVVVTATPSPTMIPTNVISNFPSGSVSMNTNLVGSLNGYFTNATYGDISTAMTVTAPVPSDGDPYALHIFGTYTDLGNATYPAFQLEGFFRSDSAYFDASSFTGIKFMWNCPSDDNSVQRFLCLVTANIAPSSMNGTGNCGTGSYPACYDYFSFTLPNTAGAWVQETAPFTTAAFPEQYASGAAPYNALQTTDLKQLLQLLWTNRSNNVPGSYTADYWMLSSFIDPYKNRFLKK